MNRTSLCRRPAEFLRELLELVGERTKRERHIDLSFDRRNEEAEAEYRQVSQRTQSRYESEKRSAIEKFERTLGEIDDRFDTEHSAAQQEHEESIRMIEVGFASAKAKEKKKVRESHWESTTLSGISKTAAKEAYLKTKQRITDARQCIQTLRAETQEILDRYQLNDLSQELFGKNQTEFPDEDPLGVIGGRIRFSERKLESLKGLLAPRLLSGYLPYVIVLCCWIVFALVAVVGLWLVRGNFLFALVFGVTGGSIATLVAAVAGRFIFLSIARSQLRQGYEPLAEALFAAEQISQRFLKQSAERYRHQLAEVRESKLSAANKAEETYQRKRRKLKNQRVQKQAQANEIFPARIARTEKEREDRTREANTKYAAQLSEIQDRYDLQSREAEERLTSLLAQSRSSHESEWQELIELWSEGSKRLQVEADDIDRITKSFFPAWDDPIWESWKPQDRLAPAVRLGQFDSGYENVPSGLPTDERLIGLGPTEFRVPALLSFPNRCSLVAEAAAEGRTEAESLLQLAMLRFLLGAPPGKVRFTIIDPVGLGQNFSAFMHLADHAESLVTSRIWTESIHIERRLTDLTEHMENVIQKYLRNQFETIEQYNASAGEVAEPYRILVVVNFPANFTESAARRLLSIAKSGERCGVHSLISIDSEQPRIHGFEPADLQQDAITLSWKAGRFVWQEDGFERLPLTIDPLPNPELVTRLLQTIGQEAEKASRVEIPFASIAPAEEEWWTRQSRSEIDVPLGRAGAIKFQHFRLGQGTSQHALVAGKTGSGKSTLLHVLITNLALHYSPQEMELYLIDFKKGVEFATYATHRLPHARVVAIESEREFGLSVLGRLDEELKHRGDLFRKAGVQDVASYRQSKNVFLPRILLIVDEFQEFFVAEDRIAQEVSLLLDRLVRQGRAFGIHVLLGSQTMGGAYTLARSTLGQMAVRIALQCSESDAHLILSEENMAARLLSRPGEGIYNDANGLVEGNSPFQVVWLTDLERDKYLERINELARQRDFTPPHPLIVFEGNTRAELSGNRLLSELLRAKDWPETSRESRAWVGEPIQIKDPTSVVFRRQSGSNLLVLGQNGEAAQGILLSSLLSLAAQHAPSQARFTILSGSPSGSESAKAYEQLASILPHHVRIVGQEDLATVLGQIVAETDRRQASSDQAAPAIFLVIGGLQRFRELRRSEDDFGFSRTSQEEPASPSDLLGTILREGPSLGVHILLWCDSLNDLNRSFDRHSMREFEIRVLFQMSAADSNMLTDTSAANQLGQNRALYHCEEEGRLEKFRPYGSPSPEWLVKVSESMNQKPLERTDRTQSIG